MQLGRALLIVFLGGCSSPGPQPAGPPAPEARPSAAAVSSASSAGPAASADAPPDAPLLPALDQPAFVRVHDAPVHSLAFGKRRTAAIGEHAWMDEGKGWRKLPAPASALKDVRIFFGRDDQPRLMGAAAGASVYLRWKDGRWQAAAYELGRVARGEPAPLYGVLGHADPEVVCKLGDVCIIKRLTGWTEIGAPTGTPFVELCGAEAWAYQGRSIWRLGREGWVALAAAPTFERADGLWSISESDVWVAEHATRSLHHFDGAKWTRSPSPIAGPRSLWAAGKDSIWLAGDGGAAHFDGRSWRRVQGPNEGLAVAYGRSADDVWLAGASGLWQSKRSSAASSSSGSR